MKKAMWFPCALVVMLTMFGATVQAQAAEDVDPGALAQRCIAQAVAAADRYEAASEGMAEGAVERIETLLAQGKVRLARHVAKESVQRVDYASHSAIEYIEHISRRCVVRLAKMGEQDLARCVAEECAAQTNRIRAARAEAVQTIRDALPNSAD